MAKPTAAKLVELAAQLVTLAVEMTSQPQAVPADEYITDAEALKRFGTGRAALINMGARRVRIGRSCKTSVADIERIIAERPVKPAKPRPPKKTTAVEGDELDRLLASGQVRR